LYLFLKKVIKHCRNYRGISLLLTTYKSLTNILVSRLTPNGDEITGDQFEFRRNRSTTDLIICICQILEEKKWEYNGKVHLLFVDFEKAYDSGEKYCTILSLNLVYL